MSSTESPGKQQAVAKKPRGITSSDLALVAVFAAFCAVISVMPAIPIGPLAVPVTLQTLAVYLTGLILGGRRGALAVFLYVAVGIAGLPIFSGFRAGPAVLAGPAAGYILGFSLAAFCSGALAYAGLRRLKPGNARVIWLFGAAVVGGFLIARVTGVPGMSINGGLSLRDAFLADLVYWPGDLVKCLAAALIAAAVHKAFPRLASGH